MIREKEGASVDGLTEGASGTGDEEASPSLGSAKSGRVDLMGEEGEKEWSTGDSRSMVYLGRLRGGMKS